MSWLQKYHVTLVWTGTSELRRKKAFRSDFSNESLLSLKWDNVVWCTLQLVNCVSKGPSPRPVKQPTHIFSQILHYGVLWWWLSPQLKCQKEWPWALDPSSALDLSSWLFLRPNLCRCWQCGSELATGTWFWCPRLLLCIFFKLASLTEPV